MQHRKQQYPQLYLSVQMKHYENSQIQLIQETALAFIKSKPGILFKQYTSASVVFCDQRKDQIRSGPQKMTSVRADIASEGLLVHVETNECVAITTFRLLVWFQLKMLFVRKS